MSSQGPTGSNILLKLEEWSSEEIENNLDHLLPELLSHLSSEDKGLVLQSVYALLVTCLPSLPIERADKSLLHHAMPAVQLLFQESLDGIMLRLDDQSVLEVEDIVETISSLLQVCNELLKCMQCVLEYIESRGQVNISAVPNVPKTVAKMMLQTFQHCTQSETLYRDIFSSVVDILGTVFRQCHQVQIHFFAVLTSNVKYNCSVDSDIVYLGDVLSILAEVGKHVMRLDIKAMAEQWKGFAKIVQIYLEPLKECFNISFPVNFLCEEICANLNQLVSKDLPRDAKTVPRLLKTSSFILKIIVKFCEQFGSENDCLKDSQSTLFQLLLALYRYSSPVLIQQNMEKTLVDDIERHLTVAADPLLSHLLCRRDFREEFFKLFTKISRDCNYSLSYLLLILSVMKRLGTQSTLVKDAWLGDSKINNVVGCLLEVLKFAHSDLSSELWMPAVVKSGHVPRNCDLYETLCCHCAGLVLSLNNEQFKVVESFLFDSLFEPYVWPSLFAGDVWCICARAGTSELVLDQLLYVADVVSALDPIILSEKAQCKTVSHFISRMCSFLSVKGKQTLIDMYPPASYPLMWYIFGVKNFPKEASLSQALILSSAASIETFLSSNCCVTDFQNMIVSLYGLCAALESSFQKISTCDSEMRLFLPIFMSLWQYVCRGDVEQHFGSSHVFSSEPRWLWNLLNAICRCTELLVNTMCNQDILLVLSLLEEVIRCCSTSIRISITRILYGLATKPLESNDQESVCSKISSLFASLLCDENSLVVEEALETFEYFAHFTVHENIVADTAAKSEQIQAIVTKYLQKETPSVNLKDNILNASEYLSFQGAISSEHKCILQKTRLMSPTCCENPHKKQKMLLECEPPSDLSDFLSDDLLTDFVDKNISDAVHRMAKDSEFLISQSHFRLLPESTQGAIRKIGDELCKFAKL